MWASILNILVANECGLEPRQIEYKLGDAHIYQQHYDAAIEIASFVSKERQPTYRLLREYVGLTIEELLTKAEQNCLDNSDRWALPIELSKHKSQELKLGKLELIP